MSTLSVGTIKSGTSGSPPTIQDSGGTEVGTFCRAWVNFNGTGTVAIRASFNVTSITDNNIGDYTVNFTNALADANYSAVVTSKDTGIAAIPSSFLRNTAQTTTSLRVGAGYTQAGSISTVDPDTMCVAIFR